MSDDTTVDPSTWDCLANWTEAEREYWWMGPFAGGVPGLVRRVRRILDVSQRGLAGLLDVSQSAVARWETGRTSPRVDVLQRMLRLARVRVVLQDEDTGKEVGPMRADGARKHGGSRFPAHTDLRATGWWVPRALREMTSIDYLRQRDRSRANRDPAIGCHTSPYLKQVERTLFGTPDDHPAVHQLAAEVEHLDELREARRGRPRAA
ncbi:helix-turn-helix domain-containing protein [Nocardioides sp.]|uniref:helix-turn-helix domain-containing protein n=1 Tax=Nocardioides sp. TaxID=35761 RepID=UPI0035ADD6B4